MAAFHSAPREGFANTKAQIESLWALGMKPDAIALKLPCDPTLVHHVCRLIAMHAKLNTEPQNDDEKHLQLVGRACMTGFPYYPRVPI